MSLPHKARKRFGQNFLKEQSIINSIIDAVNPMPNECILEIGPGQGALTKPLLKSGAIVNAVEIDRDLSASLLNSLSGLANFHLYQQDFLKFELSTLNTKNIKVVGNLPYNISTPIMFKIFEEIDLISDLYIMVQYEVAERLLAQPHSKEYGRLSVMAQYFCDVSMVMIVPNTAFDPKPKVTSAIVHCKPKIHTQEVQSVEMLRTVTTMAFNMRRKVISNSLKPLMMAEQLTQLNIDPQLRPENLAVQDFVKISNFVSSGMI